MRFPLGGHSITERSGWLESVSLSFQNSDEFLRAVRIVARGHFNRSSVYLFLRKLTRRLRIPLIPANADADFSKRRVPRAEAKIARREIKFLVVKRVVGNVHLAIHAEKFSVGVNDRSGVVVNAGRAFFKKRRDDHDAQF